MRTWKDATYRKADGDARQRQGRLFQKVVRVEAGLLLDSEVFKVFLAVVAARHDGGDGLLLYGQGEAKGGLEDGQGGEHPDKVAGELLHFEEIND
jgi:hypothetical protein